MLTGGSNVNRSKAGIQPVETSKVYCPMCTHTVEAEIVRDDRRAFVRPGQKCARCLASLDAGYIFKPARAA